MRELETLLILVLVAVILAALARRVGAPYPVFLALGGSLLAFLPGAPSLAVPPELALALFIAPVLLDAAYDASLRDLKDNWVPITGLVVVAVALTTAAVALVTRALVPEISWAAAIVLGAVVAPPDAAAATAVLRPMRPPRRILTILEGESLLNDATALLIFRLAVVAVVTQQFSLLSVAPAFLLAVVGSLVAGPLLGWLVLRLLNRVQHVPTVMLQYRHPLAVPSSRFPSATAHVAADCRERTGDFVGRNAGHSLSRSGNGTADRISVSRSDHAHGLLCCRRHAGHSGPDTQASLTCPRVSGR